MPNTNGTEYGIPQIVRFAKRHPLRWLLPTLLIGGIATAYALLVYQPNWKASQPLTVREDHTDNSNWNGHFNEADQLKHTQETFLELARSPSVVASALRKVGPPPSCTHPDQWPTLEDVATMRERTEVVAPNGTEFGTTRMFYLNVQDPDPERAVLLATAICDEAERRFKQLRDRETRDAIAELTNTVKLASEELERETARLRAMETSAGSDLAELRMLSESFAGGSNLQTTLTELRQELRQAESTYSANDQLLELLIAAQKDPAKLVATPNRLLDAQPALRRLKEGLIDAQLNTSRLLGTMSAEHPRIKAAVVAEEEIRGHLHRELDVAIRGLRAEQLMYNTRIHSLTAKIDGLQKRLQKLAAMRASYTNQLAEVRQQTASLTRAQQELNATRANLAAGDVTSLVTRVDAPQTGPYPEGPGRSVIAAAGCVGGLLAGFGIVLLTLPTPATASFDAAADESVMATHQEKQVGEQKQEQEQEQEQEVRSCEEAPSPIQHHVAPTTPPVPVLPQPTATTPPTPHPAANPAGRSMTLKEALFRCSQTSNSWN